MSSSRGVADIGAVAPAVLWALVALRWRSARGTRYQRQLWVTLLTSAVAATLADNAVSGTVAAHLGSSGLLAVTVAKHVFVLATAAMAIELVRDVALPESVARMGQARRLVVLAAAAVVLAGSGAAVATGPAPDLALPGAPFSAALAVYWLALMGYLGLALVLIVRWAAWFRFRTPAAPVRTGLSLIGAGSAVGLVYVLHKLFVLALLAIRPDAAVTRSAGPVETVLIAVAFVLIASGCAMPAISHSRSHRTAGAWAYAELGPLWRRMYAATPEIALIPPSGSRLHRAGAVLRDLRVGTYRRVIEIRDGELAVRGYAPPVERAVISEQARVCGVDPETPGLVEATELELACRSKRRGGRPVPPQPGPVTGGADLDGEVAHLRAVSRAGRLAGRVADRVEHEVGL